ncbi:hypothetical protein ABZV46_47730, partial [Streptomyces sp. NPDC005209]
VERRTAFGKVGATVRIGTGVRAIGRSSYTYGQGMFVDGHLVATAEATIVLADKSGPIILPDELRADLEELQLPQTSAADASKCQSPRNVETIYAASPSARVAR